MPSLFSFVEFLAKDGEGIMLINFTFRNYRSFLGEACLSFTATEKRGQSERLLVLDRRRLLGAAGIFGPNGAGKSNVLRAAAFMCRCVLESAESGLPAPETFGGPRVQGTTGEAAAALDFVEFKPAADETSLFEMEFIDRTSPKREIYKYGFVLGAEGVEEEWLTCRARYGEREKELFRRWDNQLVCAAALVSRRYRDLAAFQEAARQKLGHNCLLLSLGPALGEGPLSRSYAWFLGWDFVDLRRAEGLAELEAQSLEELRAGEKSLGGAAAFLRKFDQSVAAIGWGEEQALEPLIWHRFGAGGRLFGVPWREESAGLRLLLALYPCLRFALERGGRLAISGLGGQLHPKSLGRLLRCFGDGRKNTNGGQLLFTSHDFWQLDNDALRQDQVWLVDKSEEDGGTAGSELYSLIDFVEASRGNYYLRKKGSYGRWYMDGDFGAVPKE